MKTAVQKASAGQGQAATQVRRAAEVSQQRRTGSMSSPLLKTKMARNAGAGMGGQPQRIKPRVQEVRRAAIIENGFDDMEGVDAGDGASFGSPDEPGQGLMPDVITPGNSATFGAPDDDWPTAGTVELVSQRAGDSFDAPDDELPEPDQDARWGAADVHDDYADFFAEDDDVAAALDGGMAALEEQGGDYEGGEPVLDEAEEDGLEDLDLSSLWDDEEPPVEEEEERRGAERGGRGGRQMFRPKAARVLAEPGQAIGFAEGAERDAAAPGGSSQLVHLLVTTADEQVLHKLVVLCRAAFFTPTCKHFLS